MKMKIFGVVFLLAVIGFGSGAEWSYDYETQWPGECRTGLKQSPINIMTRSAIYDKDGVHLRGPLVFRGYNSVNATGENNGHTLKWTIVEDIPMPVVSGGPLRGNYSFLQFHLHWLSEHAIDGMKYPMEIHMVHIKTGLTVDEALKRPDGLAVIGVMCQVFSEDEESEFALGELAPVIPQLVERENGFVDASIIDISRLFSPEPQSYFTYHGSLTTPFCQEVVTWIVMDKPLTISDTQFKLFSKVDIGGIDNYRSLQRPHNRIVYRSTPSSSSIVMPNSLSLLASLFSLKTFFTATLSKGICILVNIKKKFMGNKLRECTKTDLGTNHLNMLKCFVVVILYLDIVVSVIVYGPVWSYDDETNWPGELCRTGGKRQSPIDIRSIDVIKDFSGHFIKYGALKFMDYEQVLVSGFNNGHTVQFSTDGEVSMHPTVTGGPLKHVYRLEQLHFHWLSEHSIDGIKYPMEIHFVHVRSDLTVTAALAKRDGLAIVSVFCNIQADLDDYQQEASDEIMRHIPNLLTTGDRVSGIILDMTKLLSSNKESYFSYLGSLTSPECNEVVIWIIFDKPIYISDAQYRLFGKIGVGRHNFRSLQALSHHLVFQPPSAFVTTPKIVRMLNDAIKMVTDFIRNITTFMSKGMRTP
ncbi:uncharacterized protein [Epargyreus clarus]|uniref:uncharacterized protein n=1 Tax=Epargyreus clarus TaxID=520877 RepID=UPI003C2B28BF